MSTGRLRLMQIGALRGMLYLGVLVLVLGRPAPGAAPVHGGWEMFPTLVFPALVPLLFMVLLLDAIMSAVFSTSRPQARAAYRIAIALDLGLAMVLVGRWWGYFGAVFV